MAPLGLAALALLAAAEIDVRADGGQIAVRAAQAPLSDVLEEVSRKTGMKIVYEGAPPRQAITVTLPPEAPPETLLQLFEGLGLNYALAVDRSGTRVETLLVVASGSTPGPTTVFAPPPPAPMPEPPSAPTAEAVLGAPAGEQEPEPEEPSVDAADESDAEAPAEAGAAETKPEAPLLPPLTAGHEPGPDQPPLPIPREPRKRQP